MNRVAPLLMIFLLAAPIAAQQPSGDSFEKADFERIEGVLEIAWGDPQDTRIKHRRILTVRDDFGRGVELQMSPELERMHGGFTSWNGKRVAAFLQPTQSTFGQGEFAETDRPYARRLAALRLLGDGLAPEGGVTGSQPWVSLLCKFSNISAEPEPLSFFQNMYDNSAGRLDHYWRESSYDNIDVVGSTAVDWVDLPRPQTAYAPTPGENFNADLNLAFDDCTSAADPFVDFGNSGNAFVGINMMFNDLLDCCAWGGGRFATLDGITKSWRVTWNPPWAFGNAGVIQHEMGHGFGLPHSNNFDDDGNPYDNPWDVMSDAIGTAGDPTYGGLGVHTNAYHKNELGWFAGGEILVVSEGEQVTATIDHMTTASTANYRMARIPIGDGSTWYTVETRDQAGSYDSGLPGRAVIIYEIDPNRSEPAWAVDGDVPPADFGSNAGTMWTVGETFTDAVNDISITVDATTANGFTVTIGSSADVIFADGFESGDVSAWSTTAP